MLFASPASCQPRAMADGLDSLLADVDCMAISRDRQVQGNAITLARTRPRPAAVGRHEEQTAEKRSLALAYACGPTNARPLEGREAIQCQDGGVCAQDHNVQLQGRRTIQQGRLHLLGQQHRISTRESQRPAHQGGMSGRTEPAPELRRRRFDESTTIDRATGANEANHARRCHTGAPLTARTTRACLTSAIKLEHRTWSTSDRSLTFRQRQPAPRRFTGRPLESD